MFQIRVHGRGGQGVVTAAELLSVAAFDSGHEAQAIPSFGSERTGAPVVAFCRLDDRPIRLREPVLEPDALIIADPTLLSVLDVFAGLRPDGYVLLNSGRDWAELGLTGLRDRLPAGHARIVPAKNEVGYERKLLHLLGRDPKTSAYAALHGDPATLIPLDTKMK